MTTESNIDTRGRPPAFDQCTQGWFQTYTGKKFYPVAPNEADVDIVDIAHALSLFNRFGGHTKEVYSVAQHSVLVAEWVLATKPNCPPLLALQALAHDFTEAYCGDVVRPLKVQLVGYKEIEAKLATVIHRALQIPEPQGEDADYIKLADNTLLMTERRDLFLNPTLTDAWWENEPTPWDKVIYNWKPEYAETMLLLRFHELYEVCQHAKTLA